MEHVIDRLGGTTAVARMLGISAPSVTFWRTRGIPIERCVAIERASGGQVMRWDLRPSDWADIWPELEARPDAPPVSGGGDEKAVSTVTAASSSEPAAPEGQMSQVNA